MGGGEDQTLAGQADALRALHHAPRPLVLANVWDVWSATIVERAGHRALATSSGALVATMGYLDGSHAPADEVFAALGRICQAVRVPVTADIEDGYGLPADELVASLLRAGLVGCNLEDSDHRGAPGTLVDEADQCARLSAVRRAADAAGVGLVLNARVDILLRGIGDEATRVDRTVARANAYLEAGADCVYPITLGIDDATASELVRRIDGPVNLLASPTADDVARLAATGARRISTGSGVQRMTGESLAEIAAAVGGGG